MAQAPRPLCVTTAHANDSGTTILACSPTPGPVGHKVHKHPILQHRNNHHQRHLREKIRTRKRQAIELFGTITVSLHAAPLVDTDKGNGSGEQIGLSGAQANQLMADLTAMPIKAINKMPDAYAHGLDLEFLEQVIKNEFLPMLETVTHFLSHLQESQAEPLLKELEGQLAKREGSLERFESAVLRWIAQMKRPPILLGGKPYLETRVIEEEAQALLEENIAYLRGFGKFLHHASILTAGIEMGEEALELFKAMRNPEARETHEVAFYTMATALAAFCLFCALAAGLELAVIGGTVGIVGGVMNAFLEPLSTQKYVSASQAAAAGHQMSKADFDRAVQILRRAQNRVL